MVQLELCFVYPILLIIQNSAHDKCHFPRKIKVFSCVPWQLGCYQSHAAAVLTQYMGGSICCKGDWILLYQLHSLRMSYYYMLSSTCILNQCMWGGSGRKRYAENNISVMHSSYKCSDDRHHQVKTVRLTGMILVLDLLCVILYYIVLNHFDS